MNRAPDSTALALQPSWRLERRADTIRCVGGPDELHVLSDLAAESLSSIEDWISAGLVTAGSDELIDVRDFLVSIGAIGSPPTAGTALVWHNVGPTDLAARLRDAVDASVQLPDSLTVVVRSGGSLAELIDHAARLGGRQLLLDLTGHHTVSIGPFVTPGFTSCIGCYGTRLKNRWGDEPGPAEPGSQRWTAIAAELLAIHLDRITVRSSPLVNATINWDLHTGATSRDQLLRAPDCPTCAPLTAGSFTNPLGEPMDNNGVAP